MSKELALAKVEMAKNADKMVEYDNLFLEFVDVFLVGIVLPPNESLHEFGVFFYQGVAEVHKHKVDERLVNLLVDLHHLVASEMLCTKGASTSERLWSLRAHH